MGSYQGHLLYRDLTRGGLSLSVLLVLWTAMGLAAFALRSRAMKFGLGFLVVSLVPVCLIHPRGGYMLYLPMVGWALYITSLFGRLTRSLVRLREFQASTSAAIRYLAFGAAIVLTVWLHATAAAPAAAAVREEQTMIRRMIRQLKENQPQLERASFLLFVNDPLPQGFRPVVSDAAGLWRFHYRH
jgi:hypothetical protein